MPPRPLYPQGQSSLPMQNLQKIPPKDTGISASVKKVFIEKWTEMCYNIPIRLYYLCLKRRNAGKCLEEYYVY